MLGCQHRCNGFEPARGGEKRAESLPSNVGCNVVDGNTATRTHAGVLRLLSFCWILPGKKTKHIAIKMCDDAPMNPREQVCSYSTCSVECGVT